MYPRINGQVSKDTFSTHFFEADGSFPDCSRYFPAVPHGFERCTYAIIFADGNWKGLKQQTITI